MTRSSYFDRQLPRGGLLAVHAVEAPLSVLISLDIASSATATSYRGDHVAHALQSPVAQAVVQTHLSVSPYRSRPPAFHLAGGADGRRRANLPAAINPARTFPIARLALIVAPYKAIQRRGP